MARGSSWTWFSQHECCWNSLLARTVLASHCCSQVSHNRRSCSQPVHQTCFQSRMLLPKVRARPWTSLRRDSRQAVSAHKCEAEQEQVRSWDALPAELWALIIVEGGLTPRDLLHVGQVCSAFAQLVKGSDSWQGALKQVPWGALVPKDIKDLMCRRRHAPVCHSDPACARTVFTLLRCQQPACAWTHASHGTCRTDDTAQYPMVLHLNGTAQRTIQVNFPALPAGKYMVALRVRASPGFQRGYVRFKTVFRKAGQRGSTSTPEQHWLKLHAVEGQAEGGQPPREAAADGADNWVQDGQQEHPHLDGDRPAAEGQQVARIKRFPFLQQVLSLLLGRFTSSWHLVEQAAVTERLLPMTPQACLGQGIAEGASAGLHHLAPEAAAGWGDILVGHVVLYRQCQPTFTFAFVQLSHSPHNLEGGMCVDCVRLVPLKELAAVSYH